MWEFCRMPQRRSAVSLLWSAHLQTPGLQLVPNQSNRTRVCGFGWHQRDAAHWKNGAANTCFLRVPRDFDLRCRFCSSRRTVSAHSSPAVLLHICRIKCEVCNTYATRRWSLLYRHVCYQICKPLCKIPQVFQQIHTACRVGS